MVEWPHLRPRPTVGDVLPELPVWPATAEQQLAWTSEELAKFLNPEDTAPTALHSCGNSLGPCPCGCRQQELSEAKLLSGGLRGVGVMSAVLDAPRHLHPAEVALLNSLPLTFRLPLDLKAGLCLIGLISAPLQSLWIYAQVLSWAEFVHLGKGEVLVLVELDNSFSAN